MPCVAYICLQWGKSQGETIKQPSVARLICNAKNRWLVNSLNPTVSSALSGSHNKQPISGAAAVNYQFTFSVFNLLFCSNQTKVYLTSRFTERTLHLNFRKLSFSCEQMQCGAH